MPTGWQKLIPSADCFRGEGHYRLDAYSEFLPPPRVGWKPYGNGRVDQEFFAGEHRDESYQWKVNEFEEALELRAGMVQVANQILPKLGRLLDGDPNTGIPRLDLADNPFWPAELAAEPTLAHERCVALVPLALSKTQDDKGRVRWTLFGNSEQGPGRGFWRSFFNPPRQELDARAIPFFCQLLHEVYGENVDASVAGLKKAGFRILPDDQPLLPHWKEQIPKKLSELFLPARPSVASAKYLLTFKPFCTLPATVRKAYLAGKLHLLPFPGSLIYWGVQGYHQLAKELPFALQIPLLSGMPRHRKPGGLRVPQSGYLHEPTAAQPQAAHHTSQIHNTYKRTHRWDKILRDQDELALIGEEHKLLHVLFSTLPDDLTLYDKPMARNIQLWTDDFHLLLDGPNATPEQIKHAMRTVQSGGLFGYRFLFPAMQFGQHAIYWHRPLVAFRGHDGETKVIADSPTGYLTAYPADKPNFNRPIEFWPAFEHRSVADLALQPQSPHQDHPDSLIVCPVRELLEAFTKRGNVPLPRTFAQQIVGRRHCRSLEKWIASLKEPLADSVRAMIETDVQPLPRRRGAKVPDSLTYQSSANREFEVTYWNTIASLSEGAFVNKNNADCVLDKITQKREHDHARHLERLGDHLLEYYAGKIDAAKMTGKALAGSLPFKWRTDMDYSWMGGWLKNQEAAAERNLIVVIPGRNRKEAVIMADHYDTAYMADRYYEDHGARLAACGADDNHSATAAMMLAAPIFLEMSRSGQLDCDIWLIHLTGEEFPADCLGARALTERLIEGTLKLHLPGGKIKDLSRTTVRGLYVSDMIAHNNDRERDVFQISPGEDRQALWLAEQAHIAAEVWNESVPVWNLQPDRVGKTRSRRSPHGSEIPEIAPYLAISGEIRTPLDPRSTIYNTDGQIFSDAGVPCVLFMENYDINRSGYHDMHDTMENIDLDYGSALCAITIESVARAATER